MSDNDEGLLKRLGKTFGDLFAGKLDADTQRDVEVTFGLVGFLAKADGLITSYESQFANKLMDELDLHVEGRKVALAAFEAGKKQDYNPEAAITRFAEAHPTGSEHSERLLDALLRLALSDERIYARERQALDRLAKAFCLTPQQLQNRLLAINNAR